MGGGAHVLAAAVAEVRREDYWIEDLVLVPFAHNGAGDLFAYDDAIALR